MEWVGRLTVVGIEMVALGLGGLWLDDKLGVKPLFALVGFAVGIAIGISHLLVMTSQDRKKSDAARDARRKATHTESIQNKADTPNDDSRREFDE